MKTKFFALFYGTVVSADIVYEEKMVRLTVQVAEVVTNIGVEHKRTWNFPRQRKLVSFDIACNASELEFCGVLKPGSEVRITTKAIKKDYVVTAVECEQQDATPFNEFLHNVAKLG